MTRIDVFELRDFHVREQGASLGQFVEEEGTVGVAGIQNCFLAPYPSAEADDNDIWAAIIPLSDCWKARGLLGDRALGSAETSGCAYADYGISKEVSAIHWLKIHGQIS